MQIDVGAQDHLHHGIVNARGKRLILGAVMQPDEVQTDLFGRRSRSSGSTLTTAAACGGSCVSSTLGVSSGGGERYSASETYWPISRPVSFRWCSAM